VETVEKRELNVERKEVIMTYLKKFMAIFGILTEKKFLTAVFVLIAVLFPYLAPFLSVKGPAIIASVTVISTSLAVLFAYLTPAPTKKEEK
jgi:VIT1/CCC1 family predicted Fe2+/Mn2+ transporter